MPKITLYTNHSCPWAHRAHIILKELGLPFDEVIIDLETPREEWYLKINPRGLVPTIDYDGTIITESGIIAQFLADAHPSHLLPSSSGLSNAVYRAQLAFFTDAFFSKVLPHFTAGFRASTDEARDAAAEALYAAVAKEIEPLLVEGKGPFYGGSETLTFAEVLSGSFLLRIISFSKPEWGLLSSKSPSLIEKTPKFKRWAEATVAHPSVNYIWNEQDVATLTRRKFGAAAQK